MCVLQTATLTSEDFQIAHQNRFQAVADLIVKNNVLLASIIQVYAYMRL
jgi:hypothetical protein